MTRPRRKATKRDEAWGLGVGGWRLGGGGGGGGLFYNRPAGSETQHLLGEPHPIRLNGPEVVRHTHHVALWPYLRHDPSDIAAAMTVGIMGLIFSGHGNKDGM